ncbi:MAG: hypothetical protein J0M18_04930 [Ignavibacteria bacterium]|nr:hypothetical protein [Ignavibacteria bacterium]
MNTESYNLVQLYIGIFTAVILLGNFIAIIIYTIDTIKLRNINNQQLILEQNKLKPDIIVYFDSGEFHGHLLFIVQNLGLSAAYNIKINFDRPFEPGDDVFLGNFIILKEGLSDLAPQKIFKIDAGLTQYIYAKHKEDTKAYFYNITVTYQDFEKNNYTKFFENIGIIQYTNRASITPPDIEKKLEEINNTLTKLIPPR